MIILKSAGFITMKWEEISLSSHFIRVLEKLIYQEYIRNISLSSWPQARFFSLCPLRVWNQFGSAMAWSFHVSYLEVKTYFACKLDSHVIVSSQLHENPSYLLPTEKLESVQKLDRWHLWQEIYVWIKDKSTTAQQNRGVAVTTISVWTIRILF